MGYEGEVNERAKRMAEVIGAAYVNLDTHDPKVLTPGGTTKIGSVLWVY